MDARAVGMAATLLLSVSSLAGCGESPSGTRGNHGVLAGLEEKGVEVVSRFDAPSGLTGVGLRRGNWTAVGYVTADGEHLLLGQLVNAEGVDVNARLAREHMPEVDWQHAWESLANAHWVREGAEQPSRVIYSFTDPNCPFCNRLWQATTGYHTAGLQVRHVLVGTLRADSAAKAAAILEADDPSAALARHEETFAEGGIEASSEISAETRAKLAANHRLMDELGISGTPVIFYKDKDGAVQMVAGAVAAADLAEMLDLPGATGG